eukprot:symbB.v1.2.011988.t1/scaffold818.1/size162012/7
MALLLECLHVGLFGVGLIAGGAVPEWALYLAWTFLVLGLLWKFQSLSAEKRYWVGACRETTLCILAYYIDSIAVYMVAVMHERRFETVVLQDNVRLLVEYLCQFQVVDQTLKQLPEFNADEAALYLCSVCAFHASDGRALQRISKLARSMCYCRLLRVLCYCCTVMPSQFPGCFVNRYDETYTLAEHWREAVTHMRAGGGCNDLIFSGHASVLTFCVLLYQDFESPRWLQSFLWCRVAHASIRIVQSRSHLSVDIVVAIILASLLWRTVALPPNDFEVWGKSLRGASLGWTSALVAALALLCTLLLQTDAGPMSLANQQRLSKVSIAEGANAGSPRIFCAMMHIETSRQANWFNSTWVFSSWRSW